MARFKNVGGPHIVADKSKPINGPDGKPTGRFEKRVINNGQTIDSDDDLTIKHAGKFERVADHGGDARIADLERQLAEAKARGFLPSAADDARQAYALHNPATAPGGQVVEGFQANGGPLNPEHAERAGVAGAERFTETSGAAGTASGDTRKPSVQPNDFAPGGKPADRGDAHGGKKK